MATASLTEPEAKNVVKRVGKYYSLHSTVPRVFCTIAFASHSGNRVSTTATINMYGVTKTIGSQGTASAE